MKINSLQVRNFRCFENVTFDFPSSIVVIEGKNGSGKTSLLEALYYACYLRSFRTRMSRELILFDAPHFFINVALDTIHQEHEVIQVGFEENEKVVKRNGQSLSSYKELLDHYRVVGIFEDDVVLVSGSPEGRRSFLDQLLFLESSDFIITMRSFKTILANRNSLLFDSFHSSNPQLETWTEQLWNQSRVIEHQRAGLLSILEERVNKLIHEYFAEVIPATSIQLTYLSKHNARGDDFESFWHHHRDHGLHDELRFKRSLFGAHLGDFSITFRDKKARQFASRGQQKLILFLLKIAMAQYLAEQGKEGVIVIDDFVTDFDASIIERCCTLLQALKRQIFITCPLISFLPLSSFSSSPHLIRL